MNYLPVGGLIGLVLLLEILLAVGGWVIEPGMVGAIAQPIPDAGAVTNTEALGHLIYTEYVYFFQAAGMVLLVAMVGAIVLTLHHKPEARRQDISAQVARDPAEAVSLVDVKPGQGI